MNYHIEDGTEQLRPSGVELFPVLRACQPLVLRNFTDLDQQIARGQILPVHKMINGGRDDGAAAVKNRFIPVCVMGAAGKSGAGRNPTESISQPGWDL